MDLVILIDCFAFKDEDDHWFKRHIINYWGCTFQWMTREIKKFIHTNTNVETIILSSYHCSNEEYNSDAVWYRNSRDFLGEIDFVDKTTKLLNHTESHRTSKYFLNWITDKHQIAMHEDWELEKFLVTNKVRNIYFCGTAWDVCVKSRPLGYIRVHNLIKRLNLDINLLVHRKCVIDSQNNFFTPNTNPSWVKTEDSNIFRYSPSSNLVDL
jgi:hypothetical protein